LLPIFLSHQFPLAWPQNLSVEARPALLEPQVALIRNVPKDDSEGSKGGCTWKRKGYKIALILGKQTLWASLSCIYIMFLTMMSMDAVGKPASHVLHRTGL